MISEIPTIDISPLYGNDLKAKQEVAAQIDATCRGNLLLIKRLFKTN